MSLPDCTCTSFAVNVDEALASVQRETQNSREGFRLWQTLQQREVAYVWRLFQARLRREDEEVRARVARDSALVRASADANVRVSQVIDERSAKDMSEYTVLCRPKLQDLLNMHTKSQSDCDAQVAAIEAMLMDKRVELSRIFQYYWYDLTAAPHTVPRVGRSVARALSTRSHHSCVTLVAAPALPATVVASAR